MTVPLWVPLLILAAPTTFFWYRDRQPRFAAGHCRRCGYDL